MKNNYKDYDTLNLYVKENKVQEIINNYQVFGWQLIAEKANKMYADIVDLTFIRPHKIDNKDELQLQQIYMEERLNELGKLNKQKHARTTSFGLCFGVILLALLVLGVMLSFNVNNILGKICGYVVVVIAIVLLAFELKIINRAYKNEQLVFKQKQDVLQAQITMILTKVKQLRGDSYGQE